MMVTNLGLQIRLLRPGIAVLKRDFDCALEEAPGVSAGTQSPVEIASSHFIATGARRMQSLHMF